MLTAVLLLGRCSAGRTPGGRLQLLKLGRPTAAHLTQPCLASRRSNRSSSIHRCRLFFLTIARHDLHATVEQQGHKSKSVAVQSSLSNNYDVPHLLISALCRLLNDRLTLCTRLELLVLEPSSASTSLAQHCQEDLLRLASRQPSGFETAPLRKQDTE